MAKKDGKIKLEEIEIPEIKMTEFKITIVGDTPLLCHRFSDFQKEQILNKQTNKVSQKMAKNPVIDFIESLYWITKKPELPYDCSTKEAEEAFAKAVKNGARFGFPSIGIKMAAAAAGCRNQLTKDIVSVLALFNIKSDNNLVEIDGSIPEMHEQMVKLQRTSADIRYRAMFSKWRMELDVRCNNAIFPKEKVVALINYGGYSVGIGDWRPEKKGNFGTFHVATEKDF